MDQKAVASSKLDLPIQGGGVEFGPCARFSIQLQVSSQLIPAAHQRTASLVTTAAAAPVYQEQSSHILSTLHHLPLRCFISHHPG